MHRRPKPIEHAVIAKNTTLRMCSSECDAAFIAPKVKPRIITQMLPVISDEFVVSVVNVLCQ
jgi:hypothetical protein